MSEVLHTLRAEPLRRFRRYPAYKDSGVEWLGEIPAHWEVKRLKEAARLHTGGTPSGVLENVFDEDGVPWVKPDHLQGDRGITMPDRKLARSAACAIGILRAGSVLVCGIGTVGKVGYAPRDVCTNQQINGITFRPPVFERYAQFMVVPLEQEFSRRANKVTIAICNKSEMAEVRVPIPPEPEQRAIAAFLDRETARIDALVAKKERLIELLQEKRTALITRAVTKGLDPTVPMKDSGVEWLGEIPAHWEVKRLKFGVEVNPSRLAARKLPPEADVSFVPMEAVGECGGLDLTRTQSVANVGTGYTYFADGDVIIAKITPCFENGKGALADGLTNGIAFGTTELHVLRARNALDRRYLFYVTLSDAFRRLGEAEMYGAGGQKRVPESFVENLKHALPPEPEQRAIAAFLDRETARIDELIAKVREGIERLKEYRTALISASVTGKIDVRANVA